MSPAFSGQGPLVAVLDTGPGHPHEAQVLRVLQGELASSCPNCRVKAYPVYDRSGALEPGRFLKAVDRAEREGAMVLSLSWNIASTAQTAGIEKRLTEISAKGKVVVGAAGENPVDSNHPLKLSETVLGKVPGAWLIGELTPKHQLAPRSNYGPELFTALLPPYGASGSSFTAPLFAAQIAGLLARKEDPALLRARKTEALAQGQVYPDLNFLFKK